MAAGVWLLAGCTSTTDATWATARNILPSWGQSATVKTLNPRLSYLRVSTAGRSALLVLGEVDDHPQGRIESWYSSESEVLKLQNGRLVGTSGLSVNWTNVRLEPKSGGYRRTRDVMPGYQFGLVETLNIVWLPEPPSEIRPVAGLTTQKIKSLRWFAEVPEPTSIIGRSIIGYETAPDGRERPVVGYQCLGNGLCLQWERL